MDASLPHVVIIGGGFAGLYAARELADAPVRLTVIDSRNHHLFQPMLYQVATAALSPGDIASPIRSVLSRQPNAEVVLGLVSRVRTAERAVELADGSSIKYDYLICAPGARHSYFGHDHWEPLAPGLKSLEDALDVRRRILLAFERAEREPDQERRKAFLNFVIVGGGPTGVEMAGSLAEIRRYALQKDFRRIDSREAVVMLIEAGERLLPSYPPELSEKTLLDLQRLGVDVHLRTMVTDIRPDAVVAGDWVIPTHTVVWAAGNTASPLLATLGAPLDRQGRVLVEPDCTIPGHPEVFVLGDAANFREGREAAGGGTSLPGIAPVAIQMGQYAARTIRRDLRMRRRPADPLPPPDAVAGRGPFSYWDKGQLAVIGRGRAVADIGKLHFSGFLAWLIWIFVHIAYLIGFRNRAVVLFEWAYSYFTYRRGARLITNELAAERAARQGGSVSPNLAAGAVSQAEAASPAARPAEPAATGR